MAKAKRIPLDAIQAMKKILDALPDRNIDKTQEEALALLNGHILKAVAKGYSVRELAGILNEGKVTVSAPTIRAHTCASTPRVRKEKPRKESRKAENPKPESPKTETVKIEKPKNPPARKAETKDQPSFYTPDKLDEDL
jgi:hypothetical protein